MAAADSMTGSKCSMSCWCLAPCLPHVHAALPAYIAAPCRDGIAVLWLMIWMAMRHALQLRIAAECDWHARAALDACKRMTQCNMLPMCLIHLVHTLAHEACTVLSKSGAQAGRIRF